MPSARLLRDRSVGDADTATPRKWARLLRPVRGLAGVDTVRWTRSGSDVLRWWSGDDRSDGQGAGGGRRRVPRADRAVPSRAAGALLPDARILPGRRGRLAGHAAGRLAGPPRLRGTRLD